MQLPALKGLKGLAVAVRDGYLGLGMLGLALILATALIGFVAAGPLQDAAWTPLIMALALFALAEYQPCAARLVIDQSGRYREMSSGGLP